MDFFFKDIEHNFFYTWDFLINDIRKSNTYNPYCKSKNYYQIFKHIISSIIIGEEIILLDSEFTNLELESLTGQSNYDNHTQLINNHVFSSITNKEELIRSIKKTNENWKLTLFTSGTTGIPKKVTHNFNSITRFVKTSDFQKACIWGFAYNPTHMAGIQVLFQALLNGNKIVRLFGLTPTEIKQEIIKNKITHLSATPTFYRLLLPCADSFPSVVRITSGGEKFNEKTTKQLKDVFPNSQITNVYASTEAGTLFASENDIFRIKSEFEHLIRVDDDNELLIHNSLMGSTNLTTGEWYHSGDLIEIIEKKPLQFRFISRKNDMINVGGYKVNPVEVEEIILTMPGIVQAMVYAKSNSVLGNIICCDIIIDNNQISESTIRLYLQSKIQEYKIPRMFRFVNKLSITRTGKVKRN